MQPIVSLLVYCCFLFSVGFILFGRHQKITTIKLSILGLFCIVFAVYLYKLAVFPNTFIDEENGFYDAYSLAQYGMDSHLIKFPVYLQSLYGQGQSVLLAYMAIPFFKILGVSLFSFRLTLVVIALVGISFTCYILNKYYSKYLAPVMLAICTAPYLITEMRFAMDCNISLWIGLLAIDFLLLGINTKNSFLPLILFYLICGLMAYSYNVAWIYLIPLVISITFVLYNEKILSFKLIILNLLLLLVEIIPILTFAVRSNIPSLNKTIGFGIFTIPALPTSRAGASFIDIHGNILENIINNIFSGFKMLFLSSDGLSWNSIQNFNAYYAFAIIIFIIGLYKVVVNSNKLEFKILLILLLSNVPIWLLVQANYNHWMFTHIPVLLVIGVGVKRLQKILPYKYIYVLYLTSLLLFANAYFTTSRFTGFNVNSIKNIQYLQKVYGKKNIYFYGEDKPPLVEIRNFSLISPYEFQRTKDNPYSKKELFFEDNIANYHRVDDLSDLKKGDLLLTTKKQPKQSFKMVKANIILGDSSYCLYRRK